MNIAFLDAQPHWSGGAKRVFLFARELSLKGHEVHVVCLKGSELAHHAMRAAREARRSGGITVHPCNPAPFLSFFSFARVTLALKKARVEVMDINSPRFYWSGLIAGKLIKSIPSKRMALACTSPGSGISRKMARPVIDLPEPDSPTMPSFSRPRPQVEGNPP